MFRRLILIGTVGAMLGICIAALNAVNSTFLRLGFLGCVVTAWLGLLMLLWKRKSARIALLIVPVVLAVAFVLPGREIDASELREDYVRRMSEFEGTTYVWGGEGARGIDCSGLPRRALRDALVSYGFRHGNGHAFRAYVEQWWFDASAKALGEGYRRYTVPIGLKGTIQSLDYVLLMPGDLAVTVAGVHILAYAGDGRWIQADPGIGSVATLDGRRDKNAWFTEPVTVHRWRVLSQRPPTK